LQLQKADKLLVVGEIMGEIHFSEEHNLDNSFP